MATLPVKWFTGSMHGAPAWARTPGSFVALLDAVLIDGFNAITLTSLVVSGGVATATKTTGHGYQLNQVVLISGATPSALNGEWRVTSIPSAQTFTFATTGIADGAATGTITCKAAPVGGWVKEFSATNKAVYRSSSTLSPRSYYKIDDTYTVSGSYGRMGRLGAYTDMTGIDAGTGQWGDMTRTGQSLMAPNASYAWRVFADSRTVYVFCDQDNTRMHFRWGDYVSINPSDTQNEMFFAFNSDWAPHCEWTAINDMTDGDYDFSRVAPTLRVDEFGALGGRFTGCRLIQDYCGYGGPSFPSPVDGGMMFAPVWLREFRNGKYLRGRQRGALWPMANQPFSFSTYSHGIDVSGVAGLEGRIIRILPVDPGGYLGRNPLGRVAIDITGPWE